MNPPGNAVQRSPVPLDAAQRGGGPFIWRFNLYHRATHALVMLSFFLLAATGLPLRFSCAPWAQPWMRLLGGVEMAGLLHRIGAVITFGYFGAHLGYALRALLRAPDRKRLLWGPDSIVPQPQDFVDFYRQLRWFFGLGPRPRFGRFSYMEKFDYFAVFWGVAIIGSSGLLLWFPQFLARWLPGWIFNVATVVHGEEAILAASFIFTIHFFNVHLRPEKFPLDAVMFTGRATLRYMEEEHPLIVQGIQQRLAEAVVKRSSPDAPAPMPSHRQSLWAALLGFLALGVGITLVGMMLWSLLC